MDVRAIASLHASARVGIVVPLYKHSAVARNRLKRRLRELIRIEWLPLLPAIDVVVKVIPSAYDRDFDALRTEMQQAMARLLRLAWPPHVDTPLPTSP